MKMKELLGGKFDKLAIKTMELGWRKVCIHAVCPYYPF